MKVTDYEIIQAVLKTPAGEKMVAYLQEKITELEEEKKTRLGKILLEANPPMDELVALKVVARSQDKVIKLIEELIQIRDYVKPKPKQKDENYGLQRS